MTERYRITFKAHSRSERLYRVEADSVGTAHFVADALRNTGWHVTGQPIVISGERHD